MSDICAESDYSTLLERLEVDDVILQQVDWLACTVRPSLLSYRNRIIVHSFYSPVAIVRLHEEARVR